MKVHLIHSWQKWFYLLFSFFLCCVLQLIMAKTQTRPSIICLVRLLQKKKDKSVKEAISGMNAVLSLTTFGSKKKKNKQKTAMEKARLLSLLLFSSWQSKQTSCLRSNRSNSLFCVTNPVLKVSVENSVFLPLTKTQNHISSISSHVSSHNLLCKRCYRCHVIRSSTQHDRTLNAISPPQVTSCAAVLHTPKILISK